MTKTVVSATTAASNLFVEAHREQALALGRSLAACVTDPEQFAAALNRGLAEIADPVYVDGQRLVAPGIGPVLGVRLPLLEATHRAYRAGVKRAPTSLLLAAYERIAREEVPEARWFAIWGLEPLLRTDPERTWQLLRRYARAAAEWITVDTLGHPYGAGILLDERRWAELEQLVYSPSRWERRLVGSTLAELPFQRGVPGGRAPAVAERGLALIGTLIGDAEPDVQKALSWALRSLTLADAAAVERFLEAESRLAASTDDGNRAWVVRDGLSKLAPESAARIKARVDGVRRRPHAPATSRAAAVAAEFLERLPAGPAAGA